VVNIVNRIVHPHAIYPDDAPPKSSEVIYRECIQKHEGKIPAAHRSDREFTCDLFLHDVKIRETIHEYAAETSVKERLVKLFFKS
jgi:hypothetical protein